MSSVPGSKSPASPLLAAALVAIGASACCAGPLVLLMLGVGGAWVANLSALEPWRPVFIGLTVLLLGRAFWQLYLVRPVCAEGQACATPPVRQRQRLLFWVISLAAAAWIAFPWYAPYVLS